MTCSTAGDASSCSSAGSGSSASCTSAFDCGTCTGRGCSWNANSGGKTGYCNSKCLSANGCVFPGQGGSCPSSSNGFGLTQTCGGQYDCDGCTRINCKWSMTNIFTGAGRCSSTCSGSTCLTSSFSCPSSATSTGAICSSNFDCSTCAARGCAWSVGGYSAGSCSSTCTAGLACVTFSQMCPTSTGGGSVTTGSGVVASSTPCTSRDSCLTCTTGSTCTWSTTNVFTGAGYCSTMCTGTSCVASASQCATSVTGGSSTVQCTGLLDCGTCAAAGCFWTETNANTGSGVCGAQCYGGSGSCVSSSAQCRSIGGFGACSTRTTCDSCASNANGGTACTWVFSDYATGTGFCASGCSGSQCVAPGFAYQCSLAGGQATGGCAGLTSCATCTAFTSSQYCVWTVSNAFTGAGSCGTYCTGSKCLSTGQTGQCSTTVTAPTACAARTSCSDCASAGSGVASASCVWSTTNTQTGAGSCSTFCASNLQCVYAGQAAQCVAAATPVVSVSSGCTQTASSCATCIQQSPTGGTTSKCVWTSTGAGGFCSVACSGTSCVYAGQASRCTSAAAPVSTVVAGQTTTPCHERLECDACTVGTSTCSWVLTDANTGTGYCASVCYSTDCIGPGQSAMCNSYSVAVTTGCSARSDCTTCTDGAGSCAWVVTDPQYGTGYCASVCYSTSCVFTPSTCASFLSLQDPLAGCSSPDHTCTSCTSASQNGRFCVWSAGNAGNAFGTCAPACTTSNCVTQATAATMCWIGDTNLCSNAASCSDCLVATERGQDCVWTVTNETTNLGACAATCTAGGVRCATNTSGTCPTSDTPCDLRSDCFTCAADDTLDCIWTVTNADGSGLCGAAAFGAIAIDYSSAAALCKVVLAPCTERTECSACTVADGKACVWTITDDATGVGTCNTAASGTNVISIATGTTCPTKATLCQARTDCGTCAALDGLGCVFTMSNVTSGAGTCDESCVGADCVFTGNAGQCSCMTKTDCSTCTAPVVGGAAGDACIWTVTNAFAETGTCGSRCNGYQCVSEEVGSCPNNLAACTTRSDCAGCVAADANRCVWTLHSSGGYCNSLPMGTDSVANGDTAGCTSAVASCSRRTSCGDCAVSDALNCAWTVTNTATGAGFCDSNCALGGGTCVMHNLGTCPSAASLCALRTSCGTCGVSDGLNCQWTMTTGGGGACSTSCGVGTCVSNTAQCSCVMQTTCASCVTASSSAQGCIFTVTNSTSGAGTCGSGCNGLSCVFAGQQNFCPVKPCGTITDCADCADNKCSWTTTNAVTAAGTCASTCGVSGACSTTALACPAANACKAHTGCVACASAGCSWTGPAAGGVCDVACDTSTGLQCTLPGQSGTCPAALCSTNTNCTACTNAGCPWTLTDLDGSGSCGSGCGSTGLSCLFTASTCPAPVSSCVAHSNCTACAGAGCKWTVDVGGTTGSCDAVCGSTGISCLMSAATCPAPVLSGCGVHLSCANCTSAACRWTVPVSGTGGSCDSTCGIGQICAFSGLTC